MSTPEVSGAQMTGKVVITASDGHLDAPVDARFGRAPWLLLVDLESGLLQQAVDTRDQAMAPQGAGIRAAETVARLGATALVTGHCGPKAFRALEAARIAVITGATGTVAETVAAVRDGRLVPADQADVPGHWA
jgi:predicted Fe-Mo cluster-binding NifX family protein